jgi:hypothetical protein
LSDFRHAELGRIIRDLEAELSKDQPDWELVLLKADDLISLHYHPHGTLFTRKRSVKI